MPNIDSVMWNTALDVSNLEILTSCELSDLFTFYSFWRSGLSGCHAGWCREGPGGGPVPAALTRVLPDWWDHWRAGSWTPRPPRPRPGRLDAGLPQVGLIFTRFTMWGTLLGISAPPPRTSQETSFLLLVISDPPGAVKCGFVVQMVPFLRQMSQTHSKNC